MINEDVFALRNILENMEPHATIRIGVFHCAAYEMLKIVNEVVQHRTENGEI
jgi:hypothetical protein